MAAPRNIAAQALLFTTLITTLTLQTLILSILILSISCQSAHFNNENRGANTSSASLDTPSSDIPSQLTAVSARHRLDAIKKRIQHHLDTMQMHIQQMDSLALCFSNAMLSNKTQQLSQHSAPHNVQQDLQTAFHQARASFKRAEWALEYFAATTAREFNGPPIDEFEEQDRVVKPATGFQVLETLLFPQVNHDEHRTIRFNTRTMLDLTARARQVIAAQELTDEHIMDALWLELARIQTLGITGFDAPILLTGVHDATVILEELSVLLQQYAPATNAPSELQSAWEAYQVHHQSALALCATHRDFAEFDRATWFVRAMNPLAAALRSLQQELHVAPLTFSSAFRSDARTIFDSAAFDVMYFAPAFAREFSKQQCEAQSDLGQRLFFDPVLSGDQTRSCATCHQPSNALTDGLTTSIPLATATHTVGRNTPTLLNAALQTAQFMDLRVAFLEDQASDVINNPAEMHGSLALAVQRLEQNTSYARAFARAFADTSRHPITELRIKQALAAFERSLIALNSRFDRFMRGDTTMLSSVEKQGFNLFMGKAKCATCHFPPLFNGTVPPVYSRTEQEVIGVPATARTQRAIIDSDVGRFALTGYSAHRYAFKTPTVRNSSLTAPYMHNGVYKTLEQVMDFYNRGGGQGIGIRNLAHQTLPAEQLHLTRQEQQAIIAFLRSLEDTTPLLRMLPSQQATQ
jgi:cytochrome c peroxidase